MTQIYALNGSPGAKAHLSFVRTGHAIAKRRGTADEAVMPDPTCHLFPPWFPWSQLGDGNGRSGCERLARVGRGLWRVWWRVTWDPHLVPSIDGHNECLQRTRYPPLQTMPPGPRGRAQVCKGGISRHTGKRWPTKFRGVPRAGLGQRVWVHIKETGGFLCSGDR